MTPCSPSDIREQLERILAASAFRRSPKLSQFLRYVSDHHLAGRDAAELKEYAIGVEVFQRGSDFDPRTDNIVRSQAHRLRALLASYYTGEGAQDHIVVDLPRGSYLPHFSLRPETEPAAAPVPAAPATTATRRWRLPLAFAAVALLGLLTGLVILRRPSVPALPAEFSIDLPGNLRLDLDAGIGVVAPDSRSLVVPATDADGLRRLWWRSFASAALRPLSGTEDAAFPFWSPDGKHVAFFADHRLKKITLPDGPVQVICEAALARGGSWSPNGTIVFAASSSGPLQADSSDGGPPRRATTLADARQETVHRWPVFLPDGEQFLYYNGSLKRGVSGVWVGSLTGRPARQLLSLEEFTAPLVVPSAAREPGWLLYTERGALTARPLDLANAEFTGDPQILASELPFPSSTGSAFHASGPAALVFVRGVTTLTRPTTVSLAGDVLSALPPDDFGELRLSPDGRTLAFERRDPALGTSDLWTLDLARLTRVRVSSDPTNDLNPTWSSDGARLVFSTRQGTRMGLRIVNLRDAKLGPFVDGPHQADFPQDWSRDRRFLLTAESSPQTMFDVWLLELAGEPPRVVRRVPVAVEDGNQRQARLSPDQRLVAYTSDHSGREDVYIQLFDGASTRRWQVSSDGGAFPLWSPDGRHLYYLAPKGILTSVSIGLTGGEVSVGRPQTLFAAKAYSYSAMRYPYAVFPDGRFLLNRPVDSPHHSMTVRLHWLPSSR